MQRSGVRSLLRELDPHMLQLKSLHLAMRILHATTNTQCSQKKKKDESLYWWEISLLIPFLAHSGLPSWICSNGDHVHWVSDAIQPSHPLLPPSPPVFNLSQHQSLFQWVNSLHQMAKVLGLQLQSFQWILGIDFLSVWLVESPCCPRDSQESTPAPQFEKHEFFGAQPSLWSNSHICTGLLEKP